MRGVSAFEVTSGDMKKVFNVVFYKVLLMVCVGGERDWKQVVCNSGVAAELAVIYMVNAGCGEYAVDFRQHPAASWLVTAVLGAISCSCGDTFASEIGSAVGSWSPRLITNLQPVPKGRSLTLFAAVAAGFSGSKSHMD